MYVEYIPNRNSPPAILLRESYREGTKIKKRTLANLSDWPAAKIEAMRRVLRGDAVAPTNQNDTRPLGRNTCLARRARAYGTCFRIAVR